MSSPPPRLLFERRAQERRRVRLDHDLAFEIGTGTETQILVGRSRVAVVADDTARDEVSGFRRDIEQREQGAQSLHRSHAAGSAAADILRVRLEPAARLESGLAWPEAHVSFLQVQPGALILARCNDIAKALRGEQAMVAACDQVFPCIEPDAIGSPDGRPAIEHQRWDEAAPRRRAGRADDVLTGLDVGQLLAGSVRHQNPSLPRQAIRAAVKAPSVRIDAVPKAQVWTVVFSKDLLGVVLVNGELDLGPRQIVEVLDQACRKTIARIGSGDGLHGGSGWRPRKEGATIPEHMNSSKRCPSRRGTPLNGAACGRSHLLERSRACPARR